MIFFSGGVLYNISLSGVGIASINGLVIGVFGFLLYFKGLKELSAGIASQLAYLEVLFAILWGILLYHERPGSTFIIGAVLILGGALGRTLLKEKTE